MVGIIVGKAGSAGRGSREALQKCAHIACVDRPCRNRLSLFRVGTPVGNVAVQVRQIEGFWELVEEKKMVLYQNFSIVPVHGPPE